MSSPFKMAPGRGPMQKTGRGIPKSMCSPLTQRDAISGKKLTGKEDFGNTTKSIDSEGMTTYTTPYSTEGTPGTPGGKFMGKDYVPSEKVRIAANKRKATLGTKGTKGTVERKTYLGKTAGVKSTFGDDKISQKAFTAPKLSRIDQINIKRFDKEEKREEIGERKVQRQNDRIKKVKEYREKTGFTPSPQTEQQAKTAKKVRKRNKRAKLFGKISSALTPSGKSGFKPGCFTD